MGNEHLTINIDEFSRRYLEPVVAELRRRQRPQPVPAAPNHSDTLWATMDAMATGMSALTDLIKAAVEEIDRRLTALEQRLPPKDEA